jgi:hypothetical protein
VARKALFLFAALILGAVLLLPRTDKLYEALWEDEVHYHQPALEAQDLHDLRYSIQEVFKPCLDFALRRWVWFSPAGLQVNERNLGLLSLIFAGLHLALWLFVPWTSSGALRLSAALLLGLCPVEIANSTDAQGYAFYSLASALVLGGFWLSRRSLDEGHPGSAWLWVLASLALGLNLHFFLWPWLGLLALLLLRQSMPGRLQGSWRLFFLAAAGLAVVAALTLWANKPSLGHLLTHPPAANAVMHWAWRDAAAILSQAWSWFGLPAWIFWLLALPGAWHPEKPQRWLWRACFLGLFPVKYALTLLLMAKSSYPVADRYFIFYVAPALLLLGLGADAWVRRGGSRAYQAAYALLLILVLSRAQVLAQQAAAAWPGAQRLAQSPANSSPTFQLFEAAKATGRPLLVLGDHAWALDLPQFYLRHLGQAPKSVPLVLSTTGRQETSLQALRQSLREFRAMSASAGTLLFFYDRPTEAALIPCPDSKAFAMREPSLPCAGIVKAALNAALLDRALKGLPAQLPESRP